MKRIGVLSDTHGKLRDEVVEILRGCDVILHAGDINTPHVLEKLREIAPLYVVRGNADREWAEGLPQSLSERMCGLRIFMVHNKKQIPEETDGYELVVYGHSHKYEEHREGGCLFLNPGSCGPRRFSQPVTMAVVEIDEEAGNLCAVRKDIVQDVKPAGEKKSGRAEGKEKGVGKTKEKAKKVSGETDEKLFSAERLHLILRDIDKGKRVAEIALKYGIAEETTEQICRLYLTHPGIDAAGVREKMGLPRDR